MRRPEYTLILITATGLYRADFARGPAGAPPAVSAGRRGDSVGLAESLRAALSLSAARPAARVGLLSEDFATTELSLAESQAGGLPPEELRNVLAYEAEPFTNMSPGASLLGHMASPDGAGNLLFWVVQCEKREFAELSEVVRQAGGGRLEGASHPAGMPLPLGAAGSGRPWRRVEHWGGMLVTVGVGAAGGMVTVRAGGHPEPAGFAGDADVWTESLGESGEFAADDEMFLSWLAGWRGSLRGGGEGLAWVFPRRGSAARPARHVLWGVALLAASLVACAGHRFWSGGRNERLERELQAARAESQSILRLQRRATVLRKEIADARKEIAERDRRREILEGRRAAFPALLSAIAGASAAEVVVRRIEDDGEARVIIHGTGWSAAAMDAFAGSLANGLSNTVWTLRPLQRVAQGLKPDAGPWDFALRLLIDDEWSREQAARAETNERVYRWN